VNSLGPITNLIVDDVDALETVLETSMLLQTRLQLVIELDDVAVVVNLRLG
jgi:hypothetical protein